MKLTSHRADIILGAGLLTAVGTVLYVLGLPFYLFIPFLAAGGFIALEAGASAHAHHKVIRMERTAAIAKHTAQPAQVPVITRDARRLFLSWGAGHPTTRRWAEKEYGIPQERWQAVVNLAVQQGLGRLEPAQGGNQVLRWVATLDQTLSVLEMM